MAKWLQRIWISRTEHERVVDDLRRRVTQLEADFVDIAHLLINDAEARRRAAELRNMLQGPGKEPVRSDNVVSLNRQTQQSS